MTGAMYDFVIDEVLNKVVNLSEYCNPTVFLLLRFSAKQVSSHSQTYSLDANVCLLGLYQLEPDRS